jgi:dihydroneopterin aldolase
VTDKIVLHDMVFDGRHGVHEDEQREPQPFGVDVELVLNLQPAGIDDDLARTVDYGEVYRICRQIVESTRFRLLEALAEAIAHELLAAFPIAEVGVRVRKLRVRARFGGEIAYAGVEIWRRRAEG